MEGDVPPSLDEASPLPDSRAPLMLCLCSAQWLLGTQRWMDMSPQAGPGGAPQEWPQPGAHRPCNPLAGPSSQSRDVAPTGLQARG